MLRQCCEGFAEGTKDDPILPFIREYVKEKNLKLTNFEITRGLNLPYGRVNRLVEILREERLQAESEKENGSSSQ